MHAIENEKSKVVNTLSFSKNILTSTVTHNSIWVTSSPARYDTIVRVSNALSYKIEILKLIGTQKTTLGPQKKATLWVQYHANMRYAKHDYDEESWNDPQLKVIALISLSPI